MNREITIVFVSYYSKKKILKYLNQFNDKFKVFIIENSNDLSLKKNLKKFKNVSIHYNKKNIGFGASSNKGLKKIKTKYGLHLDLDTKFSNDSILKLINQAKKLDEFIILGPKIKNYNYKTRDYREKNIFKNLNSMNFIDGCCMLFNMNKLKKFGYFDENFFLYFEETDYCKRGNDLGIPSYQLNRIIVKSIGRTVETGNEIFRQKLDILTTWHFIWSKFYYFRKNYGYIFSILYFLPTLIRIIFRINLYKILKQKIKTKKYIYRLDGLLKSIRKKKSHLRIEDI